MATRAESLGPQGAVAADGTQSSASKMTQLEIRQLRPATYSRVAEISPKQRRGVNLVARVLRVLSLLEHTGMDGEHYRDIDVYVGDETAVIRVQGSGSHVDVLNSVGETVVIRNAHVETVFDNRQAKSTPIYLRLKPFSKVSMVSWIGASPVMRVWTSCVQHGGIQSPSVSSQFPLLPRSTPTESAPHPLRHRG